MQHSSLVQSLLTVLNSVCMLVEPTSLSVVGGRLPFASWENPGCLSKTSGKVRHSLDFHANPWVFFLLIMCIMEIMRTA